MRYLSLFSGIEAATMAWQRLGWEAVAFCEFDKFPSAVLSHHYPDVPNLGDITEVTEDDIKSLGPIDLIVGGSPCQDLSVAGKRAGLVGERSGLFHHQMRIFHAARHLCGARFCLWENVPGAFSSNRGRDFAVVVGSMAGSELSVPRNGWRNAGACIGRNGLVEWRCLDAQYVRVELFPGAVPQRRRRVFALLDTGDWRSRPPILLEPESLRGNPPPGREAGQEIADVAASGAPSEVGREAEPARAVAFDMRGREGGAMPEGPHDTANIRAASGGSSRSYVVQGFGGNRQSGPIDVATAVNAHGGPCGRMDFESETFIAQATLDEGQTPIPVAFHHNAQACQLPGPNRDTTVTDPRTCSQQAAVAFPQKENCDADATQARSREVLLTLRGAVGAEAYQQWGVGILAAFQSPEVLRSWLHGESLRGATEKTRPQLDDGTLPRKKDLSAGAVLRVWLDGPDGRTPQGRELAEQLAGEPGAALSILPHEGTQPETDMPRLREAYEGARLLRQALSAVEEVGRSDGGQTQSAHAPLAVRRLTPVEAERLQGFPDNFTRIPIKRFKKEPKSRHYEKYPDHYGPNPDGTWTRFAADGPRYKALGNSMAVNCMQWLGQRIQMVSEL